MTTTLLTTDQRSAPIPHDFPFPICCACGFPIPPHDVAGSEFRPRHASTCTDDPTRAGNSHSTRKEVER